MDKIKTAIEIAVRYGGIDGGHHKAWVIDQMVRALTSCPMVKITAKDCNGDLYTMGESEEYLEIIRDAKNGEDGPETYDWDVGIAP